ncbi:L-galactose dehydrogenase [Sarcoptes scabiei]|uniref:L-galactose dehydrogenase n=1 Tax=Sarcoptes scabiei TaxID=52283 RepID=A0A834R5T6_SARSC|nr:L-galactose dehydrogenase [Sarcoptes scabiei]
MNEIDSPPTYVPGCTSERRGNSGAIRSGVNLIDTSPFYGQSRSEQCLGEALRDLPRSSFYLATKVGRHPDCSFDYGAKAVARSLESSLERLNVNHIDLVQIHDVEFCPSQSNCLTNVACFGSIQT